VLERAGAATPQASVRCHDDGVPTTAGALVRACHPEPTAGVTALSTALAVAAGAGPGRSALVAATVLTGQLSIGWCNDLVDRGRDASAGRTDKPVASGQLAVGTTTAAAAVALGTTTLLSGVSGLVAGSAAAAFCHLGVVAGGWAYDLGLKRTAWSWLPYAVAFGLLPAYCVLAAGRETAPWWLVAAGALLGTGAHFFNVLPDLEDDRATGVRSLPVRMGAAASRSTGCALLVSAALALVLGPPGQPSSTALVGLGVAVVPAVAAAFVGGAPGSRSRTPFLLALAAAAADLLLLVLLVRGGTALG
jgi:4-hydroxybenzoate polyprenyltransferase